QLLDGPDDLQRVLRGARYEVGAADRERGRRLGPEIDQDRAAAGAVTGLDVVEDVADEPGATDIEVQLGRGPQYQAGPRLPAAAQHRQLRDHPVRVVRTVVDGVEPRAAPPKLAGQVAM